uniref:FERM domain-containing protein n=2 Tax=Schistocephalus solidus TaxID=70667 RepID=A0A0X3PCD3_SCHSO
MSLSLAVSHAGLLVFHETAKVNTFSWARIRKLSFKRKKFFIKLHPEGYDAVEFIFDSRNECKNFWKQCIEHHAFFRCQAVKHLRKRKGIGVPKGSSFRYFGRTQNQLREVVRENARKLGPYDRSASTGRVPAHRSPSLSMSGGVGHHRHHHGTLSSTAVNQLDPSQSIGSGSLTCADDSMVMQQAASSSSTPGGAQCLVRSLASLGSNAAPPISPSSSPQDGGFPAVLQKSDGSRSSATTTATAYVQLPQGSLRAAPYGQRVMLLMRPGVAGAAGGVSIVPLVASATSGSSAQVLTTRAIDMSSSAVAAVQGPSSTAASSSAQLAKDVTTQRPDFLVMLPTHPIHQPTRDVPDQRIGINSEKRCATPDCVAAMHSSLLMNRPRNGAPASNVAPGDAAMFPQVGHNLSPQPHAQLASGIRLVSSNILAAAPGLSSACAVLPSQRSAGRIFYVDSATGRLLSDGQFVAVPPTSSLGLLNAAAASNGGVGPLGNATATAPGALAAKSRAAATDLSSAGITLHQAGEDVSTTILHDDTTAARCGHALVSIAGASSTTTMASSLGFDQTGDSLGGSIGRAGGGVLRPRGAPPPAPERRDSVRPRERLDSSDVTTTTAVAPVRIDDAVVGTVNTTSQGEGNEDKRTRRELPPPPLPEPDPAHPYPFNVIPVNFFAQRSFEASCLSLAARSTRSSCQSIVDETNLEGENTTTAPQPVRLRRRRRRRRSDLPPSPGHVGDSVERGNSVEGSDASRPISRSASLHRSSGSASSRSLNASGERASMTQDDMAIIGVGSGSGGGGEVRHLRCHSVVDPALSGVSNADAPKTPLASVSKTSRHRASGSNSRRSSVSSSHHTPKEPMSMAYHLLRELTMTERTYRKDLDVVCMNFCSANLSGQSLADSDVSAVRTVLNRLFTLLEPIRNHHTEFLRGLESRFSNWSGQSASRKSVDVGAGNSTAGCADSMNSTPAGSEDTPVSPIRVGDLFVTNLKMLKVR